MQNRVGRRLALCHQERKIKRSQGFKMRKLGMITIGQAPRSDTTAPISVVGRICTDHPFDNGGVGGHFA